MSRSFPAAAIAFLFLAVATGSAATRTWTGASITMNGVPQNNLWTNPYNWMGNVAPVAGDDLFFNGGSQLSSVNDFSAGTTFNFLTVRGHSMEGAAIALNSGLSATAERFNFSVVKIAEINLAAIKLNNPQTFNAEISSFTSGVTAIIGSRIDNNGNALSLNGQGFLSLQGAISGSGGLIKMDFGTVQLLADNSYTGVTTINKGEFLVYGSQPASTVHIDTPTPQFGEDPTLGGDGT